jgi:hypothetical protein
MLGSSLAYGQGEISGIITDDKGEPLPFINVVVMVDGIQVAGTATDFDGKYAIKPLSPGTYDLVASHISYHDQKIEGITVNANKIRTIDIELISAAIEIDVKVIAFKNPPIDPQKPGSTRTMTDKDIEKAPARGVNSLAAISGSVYQADDNGALNLRGGRSSGTRYYVDDMPVFGGLGLPPNAIQELTVLTGGIPARYGDATGGVINIYTRGPSPTFRGQVELITSEFLDAYGYNLFNFAVTGPLLRKKIAEEDLDKKQKGDPLLSFRLNGELQRIKDGDPSRVGMYRVKDDVLSGLEEQPLRPSSSTSGFEKNAEYITKDDLEHIKYKQNVAGTSARLVAALDLAINKNTNLTFGGNGAYSNSHAMVTTFSLFNPGNNPKVVNNSWRVYSRFTQKFGSDNEDESEEAERSGLNLRNAFYSVQLSYQSTAGEYYDEDHNFNPFSYGHVGNFTTYDAPFYFPGLTHTDTLNDGTINSLTGVMLLAYLDTFVDYTAGSHNPGLSAYTDYYTANSARPTTLSSIQLGGGLANGDLNENTRIYSLYYNTGVPYFFYGYDHSDQFRLRIQGSVDLQRAGSKERNKHAIEFGIEYEQNTYRNYDFAPYSLWTTMRQLANRHLANFDQDNPILLIGGQQYLWSDYWVGNQKCPTCPDFGTSDTIFYNRQYVESDQAFFDRSLREALGLPVNGLDIIDVDALDPSEFDLKMFSADELIQNGHASSYYGYDYLGNKLKSQPSFEDYFTAKDEFGNFTRPIAAYQPIYTAAYVQDKFVFKDLNFNIGVRIDRFDANQKVLKDRYSLYDVRSASEVTEVGGLTVSHPATIGDDFAVYVDDISNPTQILGYRDEDTWFNSEGEVIADPSSIAGATTTGQIQPYLVNPNDDIKDEDFDPSTSFTDYEPQVNVMPRIAFTFPISDQAQFFAHYDELTQRPPSSIFTTARSYYFLVDQVNPFINNAALKPEKTVDYQVGFEQMVSKTSAITISGFYREMRDMVQQTRIVGAYPVEYRSSSNLDFGTVKGVEFTYDLRRIRGSHVSMYASYTLQFADGTGSSSSSQANLVSVGLPNLRTIIPLNIDQRHNFSLSLDYIFGSEKDYNGISWTRTDRDGKEKVVRPFENAGFNMIFQAGSGTPYTRQANATPSAQFGVAGRSSLEGSLNGSRRPWRFDIDARFYKDFTVKFKADGKDHRMNAYVWIQNLLNATNIQGVYPYTGNPDDDGYLSSPEGQQLISSQINPQSFVDLYEIKVNNPNNYSIPRRIRVGLQMSF